MNPWLFWMQLMVSFWAGMLHRPRTAEIYYLDDYRPENDRPTDKKPNGRAA